MANRAYLYSVSDIPAKNETVTVKGIGEFKNNLPLSFLVLASGNPKVCESLVWKNEKAILGDYDIGLRRYKKLIEMLLKNGVQQHEYFSDVAEKSLEFLENKNIKQRFFLLETFEIIEFLYSGVDNNDVIQDFKKYTKYIDDGDFEKIKKGLEARNIIQNWDDIGALIYPSSDPNTPRTLAVAFNNNEVTID